MKIIRVMFVADDAEADDVADEITVRLTTLGRSFTVSIDHMKESVVKP